MADTRFGLARGVDAEAKARVRLLADGDGVLLHRIQPLSDGPRVQAVHVIRREVTSPVRRQRKTGLFDHGLLHVHGWLAFSAAAATDSDSCSRYRAAITSHAALRCASVAPLLNSTCVNSSQVLTGPK